MKKSNELGNLLMEINDKKIYENGNVITKVFSSKTYSGSDVFKEAMNQTYALELGINVPKVLDVFPVGNDWAISSEKIEGKTLAQLISENPGNEKKYIAELVKIQLHLLSFTSDNKKLPKLKDKLNDYISKSGLDATTRYDLHVRLEKMPNHYKLCHGDIDPRNVIIRNDGAVFVLDWAHATRGNASADAAMSYLLFVLNGDEKGAQMYVKEFCKKSDIALQYVQEWISVVSATKLATTTDESQKELLLKNINVVEY